MKISKGLSEEGIVIGNVYDKYGSNNPLIRWLMRGYEESLNQLISMASPKTIHDVGCGEGYWVIRWNQMGFAASGSDFSSKVIEIARDNARAEGLSRELFFIKNIYDLQKPSDSADLLACCEVLEHLEKPKLAIEALHRAARDYVLISVPREPLWRLLNISRGKYLADWGNPPGHLQHWSSNAIVELVQTYFEVVAIRRPIPWTMVLARPR